MSPPLESDYLRVHHNPDALFIGVDLGTSGCRAVAINLSTEVVAEARCDIALPHRVGPCSEQEPLIWWNATKDTLSSLLAKIDRSQINAIAVDGTSGTVLLVDKEGHPLTSALMYNDARAQTEAQRITQVAPKSCAAHGASSGLAKLLWLQHHSDTTQVKFIANQADWITAKLTNKTGISDKNNCLKLGYNPIDCHWPPWLEKLGVNMDWLPEVISPGNLISPISADSAKLFDLPKQVNVIAGTTDSTAAFLATGVARPGQAVTSLGSTLVLKTWSDTPVFAPEYGIYSQPLGDHWLVGGGSNSGGAVLLHYFTDAQLQSMTRYLQPERLVNLDYYPLLSSGERFPVNDSHVQPKLFPRPKSDVKFFQAILEGIAHIELLGYKRLSELGVPYPETIYTVGGGAKNRAWQQIRKKRLDVEMITPKHDEAAYGSALLAIAYTTANTQ